MPATTAVRAEACGIGALSAATNVCNQVAGSGSGSPVAISHSVAAHSDVVQLMADDCFTAVP